MYKHFLVNAFPRSGSVFFASVFNIFKTGGAQFTSLHLPHIIGNDKVDNAVVIRDPYECMSSLLYKNHSDQHHIVNDYQKYMPIHLEEYMVYINKCIEFMGSPNLYVSDFNKLINDPVSEFNNVVEKFSLEYDKKSGLEDPSEKIKSSMSSFNMLNDKDGHMPRGKSDLRKTIEDKVYSSSLITEVYTEYKKLIGNIKN